MKWNEDVQAALRAWLAPSTAHKEHPVDDARFYRFIAEVWRAHHGLWDEALVRDRIAAVATVLHPDWAEEIVAKIVESRRKHGTLILDFLTSLHERNKVHTLASQ